MDIVNFDGHIFRRGRTDQSYPSYVSAKTTTATASQRSSGVSDSSTVLTFTMRVASTTA